MSEHQDGIGETDGLERLWTLQLYFIGKDLSAMFI